MYSHNRLLNPDAAGGTTAHWAVSGVTVVNNQFVLVATASMLQEVTPTIQPPDYRVGVDFLGGTTGPPVTAFMRVTFVYADGSADTFVKPFRDETGRRRLTGSWMRIGQICPVRTGVLLTRVRVEAITAGAGMTIDRFILQENLMPDPRIEQPPPIVEPLITTPPADEFGANTGGLKHYPNWCWNSSFERFDTATMRPFFWATSGGAVTDQSFDGTTSLRLAAGQFAEQQQEAGAGLADPAQWPMFAETRVSFRVRGSGGSITVRVMQGAVTLPLWHWRYERGVWTRIDATTITFTASPDWHDSLRTFAARPTPGGGRIRLRIENSGTFVVHIDAVVIEPDRSGRWPSMYSDGPESSAPPPLHPLLDLATADLHRMARDTHGVFTRLEWRRGGAVIGTSTLSGGIPPRYATRTFVSGGVTRVFTLSYNPEGEVVSEVQAP